jgi:hypothetical protein
MTFDRTKDVELASKEVLNDGSTIITVGIYQYNGGVQKVQIKREIERNGERKFAKLGRLTIEEAEAVKEGLAWSDEWETAQVTAIPA